MAEPSPDHLRRDAYIYVRQSTLAQTMHNTESLHRQYDLSGRAKAAPQTTSVESITPSDGGGQGERSPNRRSICSADRDAPTSSVMAQSRVICASTGTAGAHWRSGGRAQS
jgi:hypothetical protein